MGDSKWKDQYQEYLNKRHSKIIGAKKFVDIKFQSLIHVSKKLGEAEKKTAFEKQLLNDIEIEEENKKFIFNVYMETAATS